VRIEFYWLAVVLTTVVSAARLTRLATVDKFPPVKWLRTKYEDATDGSDWQWLTMCGYCFSFWATAFVFVWGLLSGVYSPTHVLIFDGSWSGWWWVVNSLLAMSYLAAMTMAHDGSTGEDD
jgi:hypothetical protein